MVTQSREVTQSTNATKRPKEKASNFSPFRMVDRVRQVLLPKKHSTNMEYLWIVQVMVKVARGLIRSITLKVLPFHTFIDIINGDRLGLIVDHFLSITRINKINLIKPIFCLETSCPTLLTVQTFSLKLKIQNVFKRCLRPNHFKSVSPLKFCNKHVTFLLSLVEGHLQ